MGARMFVEGSDEAGGAENVVFKTGGVGRESWHISTRYVPGEDGVGFGVTYGVACNVCPVISPILSLISSAIFCTHS